MEFNIPKCNIIPVTTLCNESNYIYSINGTPLQTVEQHLYLGVYLHHKMSWQPQVDYVCNKANPYSMLFVEKLRGSSRTLQEASYLHFRLLLYNMGSIPSNIHAQVRNDPALCRPFCPQQTMEENQP